MTAFNVKHPVVVNVYDMVMPMNAYTMSLFGFGIFHSGVEVYGNEYAFGGHFSPVSGIYDMQPKDALVLGENFALKQSIVMGYTDYTENDVQLLISHLGQKYKGNQYHIVRKNCNHFTKELCLILVGREIPKWVNRLAVILSYIPYLDNYLENCMGLQGAALSLDETPSDDSIIDHRKNSKDRLDKGQRKSETKVSSSTSSTTSHEEHSNLRCETLNFSPSSPSSSSNHNNNNNTSREVKCSSKPTSFQKLRAAFDFQI